MLRFLTAGESHGKGLVVILEGMPAGLHIDFDAITEQLRRRQGGYGRGRRMAIESDKAEILSGVRAGETLGSPIALLIRNKDWENWQQTMHAEDEAPAGATGPSRHRDARPRPGTPISQVRSNTTAPIFATCSSRSARAKQPPAWPPAHASTVEEDSTSTSSATYTRSTGSASTRLFVSHSTRRAISAPILRYCADLDAEMKMIAEIDRCRDAGDTAGGAFEVIVRGLPVGLGSYVQWDRKLDGRLAQAMMSIPAIKGVGVGIGPKAASVPGSQMHDEIVPAPGRTRPPIGVARPTNNAGGLEGGVTNGEDLRVSGYMKPIATLMKPLRSVDLSAMSEARPSSSGRRLRHFRRGCRRRSGGQPGACGRLPRRFAALARRIERNYANAAVRLQARVHAPTASPDRRARRR
jgi:chorismate synthase